MTSSRTKNQFKKKKKKEREREKERKENLSRFTAKEIQKKPSAYSSSINPKYIG